MPRFVASVAGAAFGLVALAPLPAESQDWTRREFPLAPANSRGNFVAPYFDGFYKNADGTYTLSFGFMNRNDSDLIEIPLGENNFIEPAQYNGVQPTSFPTVSYGGFGGPRERGAFAVVVPADYEGDVVWTLTTDGYTTKVPGRIRGRFEGLIGFEAAYELGTTPQAEGSLRPALRFAEGGPDGIGLLGIQHPQRFTTRVGQPIEVSLWAFDRGERELKDVNLTLWKHQGPVGATISFESFTGTIQPAGGRGGIGQLPGAAPAGGGRAGRGGRPAATGPVAVGQSVRLPIEGPDANMGRFRATFDTPGEYLIRVRIDNFTTGDSAPGNQCCWSNGYVRVNVTN
ncbi:MAG: hypothetical protein WEB90_05145 [Gemmatimonadota bacterium]